MKKLLLILFLFPQAPKDKYVEAKIRAEEYMSFLNENKIKGGCFFTDSIYHTTYKNY